MKKFFSLLLIMFMLCLVSCKSKNSDSKSVSNLISNILECDTYKSVCNMELIRDDKTTSFNIETLYMKEGNYCSKFLNSSNNVKQIILKNSDGVYALTPSLGKEFKFESEWPLNSSHIYIPTSVINDYNNDPNKECINEDGRIYLTSTIKHKTHDNYIKQKIMLNSKKNSIETVTYYDTSDNEMLKATYTSIVYDCKLSIDDFNPTKIIESEITSSGEGSVAKVEGDVEVLYTLDGTTLSSKNDNVFVYKGDSNYTISILDIEDYTYSTISRIYNDFEICDKGLAFINNNSITVLYQNKEISVFSNSVSVSDMLLIVDSIVFS